MLDLALDFERIIDAFNQRAFSYQEFIKQWHEFVFHVLFYFGNHLYSSLIEMLKEFARDVALVAGEFTAKIFGYRINHRAFAVINIAGREVDTEQFAALANGQMELEPMKPAGRGFTAFGNGFEDLVLPNALVLADINRRRINERNAGAFAIPCAKEQRQGQHCPFSKFDQAVVAWCFRKLAPEFALNLLGVKPFECPVT
jgi:hypothetical protein